AGLEAPTPPAPAPSNGAESAGGDGSPMVQTATNPGLQWDVPKRWTDRGPGTMRLATYVIAGHGGTDDAQCAVYFFGPGQGGDVEANLSRWRGEFKSAEHEKRRSITTKAAKVTRISLRG